MRGMNQMKRLFLFCITCFCLFLIAPKIVYGENTVASTNPQNGEEAGKSRSILLGIVKKVDYVLKDKTESSDTILQETDNSKHETGTNLFKSSEGMLYTSGIEATGNLLNLKVTDTLGKTSSEVTHVVNETVNSVVNGLALVPIVTQVVKDVSETVKKTTSSVQTNVENTVESVSETLKSPIDVSKNEVIQAVEKVNKVITIPLEIFKNDEKAIRGNENVFTIIKDQSRDVVFAPVREPITLAPEIGTDALIKQVDISETEKHTEINVDDGIEISETGDVNGDVDFILEEIPVDRQSVAQELKVLEQANGLMDPFVKFKTYVLENESVDNSNLPTESRQKGNRLPPAIIMEAPMPTESLALAKGGKSDMNFWETVDVLTLKSTNGGKWKHTNEYAMVKWAHAPPGKPPQQSSF